ncbi:uncharacterized protein LOC144700409 isoform X2 [Wolffia australiana]
MMFILTSDWLYLPSTVKEKEGYRFRSWVSHQKCSFTENGYRNGGQRGQLERTFIRKRGSTAVTPMFSSIIHAVGNVLEVPLDFLSGNACSQIILLADLNYGISLAATEERSFEAKNEWAKLSHRDQESLMEDNTIKRAPTRHQPCRAARPDEKDPDFHYQV